MSEEPKKTTRPRKVRLRPGLLAGADPVLVDATQADPSTFPVSEPPASKSARAKANTSARAVRLDNFTQQPAVAPAPVRERLSLRDRLAVTKDILLIAATALAGIWAIGTFYYQFVHPPSQEPSLVTSDMSVSRTGERNGLVSLNARLTLKNSGKSRHRIWGVALKAYGFKAVRSDVDKSGWSAPRVDATRFEAFRGVQETSLVPIGASIDAVTGPNRNQFVEANGEASFDFPFYADKTEYDGVRVKAFVLQSAKNVQAKPEWIEVAPNDEESPFTATETCKADTDCKPTYLNFGRTLSLW